MLTESLRFNDRHTPYAVVPVATKDAPQLSESYSELWVKKQPFQERIPVMHIEIYNDRGAIWHAVRGMNGDSVL